MWCDVVRLVSRCGSARGCGAGVVMECVRSGSGSSQGQARWVRPVEFMLGPRVWGVTKLGDMRESACAGVCDKSSTGAVVTASLMVPPVALIWNVAGPAAEAWRRAGAPEERFRVPGWGTPGKTCSASAACEVEWQWFFAARQYFLGYQICSCNT